MIRQRPTAKAFSCCSFVFGKFWNNFIFEAQLNPNFSSTAGHTTHLPPAQMGWSSHESKAKRNWNNKEIKDDINLLPGLVNTNLFCFFQPCSTFSTRGSTQKSWTFPSSKLRNLNMSYKTLIWIHVFSEILKVGRDGTINSISIYLVVYRNCSS